jgi:succinate dehydrogenase/fumarate reductase cytochrome b subunit
MLAMGRVNGFWGLIILVADVWAIINVIQSRASTGKKVLWTVLIILLPVLGFIIWFLAGPKSGK